MSALYCIYCGQPRDYFCRECGENHLATAEEFKDYHGEWPDDGVDHEGYETDAAGTFEG